MPRLDSCLIFLAEKRAMKKASKLVYTTSFSDGRKPQQLSLLFVETN